MTRVGQRTEKRVLGAAVHLPMRGGLLNKARRGELRCPVPVGLLHDAADRVVLDPDTQVQESVHLLFQTFARTGAVSATVKEFRQKGILFPTRLASGARKGELSWVPLSVPRAAHALHNPWYAGAYVYGRGRYRKKLGGQIRHESLPRSSWQVCIKDAHPAYISFEEYERIQERLKQNAQSLGWQNATSPPREGSALLQGRAVCGLCGSRMHVRYNAQKKGPVPSYVCVGRGRDFCDPSCQSIVGRELDTAIGTLLVEAVTPLAVEFAFAVQKEITDRIDDADRLRHRQVERSQYEANAARHRYMQVDPTNRLVADSLEANWNEKLRALAVAQQDYQRQRTEDRVAVDDKERQRVLSLATDFPSVWRDPKTPHRERKRMLGLLIEDVTLIKGRQLSAAVRFRGGATTMLTLPRPLTAQQQRATHDHVRKQIDELLDEYTDAQVARALNEQGLKTGAGDAFGGESIRWVRHAHKLKSLKRRLLDTGWRTGRQIQQELSVSRATLGRWRTRGQITARLCNDAGEWLYQMPNVIPITKPRNITADTPVAEGAL